MIILTKFLNRSVVSVALILGLLVLHSGCAFLDPDVVMRKQASPDKQRQKKTDTKPNRKSADIGVKVQSNHLALNETENPAIAPQQLINTVSELLAEQKPATARCLVQAYPDVAWGLLRNATADQADSKALQTVAAAHDHQCTDGDAASGWQALFLDRSKYPNKYRNHDRRRADFLAKLRNGDPREALTLGLTRLPEGTPGMLLGIDAWHMTGMALLLDERPGEATDAFAKAIEMARSAHPYQTAHLKLLLSDAQRRVGNAEAADTTWHDAVQVAGNLVSKAIPVTDPIFWERAAYLRPVDKSWPASSQEVLAQFCQRNGVAVASSSRVLLASAMEGSQTMSDEQFLWACIGCWRLDRGAPQAALVALKRAEAMASTEVGKQRLQLAQAKALLALDQPAAATATLVRLAGSSDRQVSRAAMATLGTAKLQSGSTKQGFNLLRQAVEENETIDWPGRAEAEADLGLAYLLVGSEQSGLRWLHRAQTRFESAGAHEHLVQSLENELDYHRQAKKKKEAKSVEKRLTDLEAS